MTTTTAPVSVDIVIVGGGMVGGVLAHALTQDGWRVAVLERAMIGRSPSYDERMTALSDGSWRYLKALGLVDPFLDQAAEPIREVRVVDAGHFGLTRITAESVGVAALGRVVANRALEAAIKRANLRLPYQAAMGGEPPQPPLWYQPAEYEGHASDEQGVQVTLRRQGERIVLNARLIVAADGAQSTVRQSQALPIRSESYEQTAIISTALPRRSHRNIGFECFTRGGPLAVLPLTGNRVSLVWVVRSTEVDALMALDDPEFVRAIDTRFGHRLGGFSALSPRHAYPLTLIEAESVLDDRLVVLGNAAHALHPVAGQGFNLCLRDIRDLAGALRADCGQSVDPGDPARLNRYADRRRDDYRRTIGLTDGLVRGFSLDLPGLGALRGAILSGFDGLLPAKRRLVRMTRGY